MTTKNKVSELIRSYIYCWNELLDGFVELGMKTMDIDFDIREKSSGQINIHFKPNFLTILEGYMNEALCCFPKEKVTSIEFKRSTIVIKDDYPICLSMIQYLLSFTLEKMRQEQKRQTDAIKESIREKIRELFPSRGKRKVSKIQITHSDKKYRIEIWIRGGRPNIKTVKLEGKSTREIISKLEEILS